ncbi:MAG: hypothetical protein HYZ34_15125 [Ignavibacteriae bacterium]|nr:hypothetical protein [Ignavibacteriota bacterium]
MSYLANGKPRMMKNGFYTIRFDFYDAATAGNAVCSWTTPNALKAMKGEYTATIGEDGTEEGSLDCTFDQPLYLQVVVLGGAETKIRYPYSLSRVQLTSVPYVFPLGILGLRFSGNNAYQGLSLTNVQDGGKTLTLNQGTVGKLNFTEPGVVDLVSFDFNTQRVGIGTTSPIEKLHVKGNRIVLESTDGAKSLSMRTDGATTDITSTGQPLALNWDGSQNVIATSGSGKVGIGTSTPTTKLEVDGYTKLGTDAPGIKIKKYSGTTSNQQGAGNSIVLDIPISKILSITVMVEAYSNSWYPDGYRYTTGHEFTWITSDSFGIPRIWISNVNGNSGSILSKPIRVLVTYEE